VKKIDKNKLTAILIVLTLLLSLLPGVAMAGQEATVDTEILNVRSGPGTDNYPVIAKLSLGTKVPVLENRGDWLKVELADGRTGWVAAEYTRLTPAGNVSPKVSVVLDGKVMNFDSPAYIDQNGRTMVPVRFVSEELKAAVTWSQELQEVGIKAPGREIKLRIGSPEAYFNGVTKTMDTAAILSGGRTFVPLRFVSEFLGAEVSWLQDTYTAKVESPAPITGRFAINGDNVNLRRGPGLEFEPLAVAGRGDAFQVLGNQGEWYLIAGSDGNLYWVAQEYASALPPSGSGQGVVTGSVVNVRSGPGLDYPVFAQLKQGERVEIEDTYNTWHQVALADGSRGWMSADYVVLRNEEPPSRTPEPGDYPRLPPAEPPAALPAIPAEENLISVKSVDTADGATLVRVGGKAPLAFSTMVLSEPWRLVVDIPQAVLDPAGEPWQVEVDGELVERLRLGQFTEDSVRLVLDLAGVVGYALYREGNDLLITVDEPTLEGKIVVIDPGHGSIQPGGWADPGATGPGETREADVVLSIARQAATELEARGAKVVLTRNGPTSLSLEGRAKIANDLGADAFISIHANASYSQAMAGTSTYVYLYTQRTERRQLAEAIQRNMVGLGLKDLGVREENFSVLRNTRVPSVLVETAFISNPAEERLLADPAYQAEIGRSIAQGISEYLIGSR